MSQSIDSILSEHLASSELEFANRLIYGTSENRSIKLPINPEEIQRVQNFEIKGYSLVRSADPDLVRIGLFQNSIAKPTTDPITEQRKAILELAEKVLGVAKQCGVQVFCFQELWTMPLGICTLQKMPWVEFAEDPYNGPTTKMLSRLAKEYDMVIVSPILERDQNEFLWNTAVVIDAGGAVLGISRKMHIPVSGRHSETYFCNASELGVPVFQTKYGRIGISICYDRHHPQNWYMHKLNGAQIVFNPSASIARFGEPLWLVEGRAAAAAHKYYVANINRVGAEKFDAGVQAGAFFGSSYVTGPNGERTKSLSSEANGLLVVDIDLNSCGEYHDNKPIRDQEETFQLRQIADQFLSHNKSSHPRPV